MDRRTFLGGIAALGFASVASAVEPTTSPQAIDRLIKQLGSPKFREREPASKALEEVGEAALPALRTAVKDDTDPEVRRRVGELVTTVDARCRLGTWRIVKVEFGGRVRAEVPRGSPELTFRPGSVEGPLFYMPGARYHVNALAAPQHMDLYLYIANRSDGRLVGRLTYPGIYRFDNGELLLCFDTTTNGQRPTEFKANHLSTVALYRLRREKARP